MRGIATSHKAKTGRRASQNEKPGGSADVLLERKLGVSRFFDLLAVLDLAGEGLRRLEAWDEMLVDDDRRVFRDVTGHFFSPLLVYEAPKAAHVDVVAFGHRVFYHFEKGFDC